LIDVSPIADPGTPPPPPEDSGYNQEDQLATLIRNKFEESRDYRRNIENERWLPGEDAYNGVYVEELRKESGRNAPYMNLTRREVTSAHIKINGMLFQNNKIRFRWFLLVLPSLFLQTSTRWLKECR